MTTQNMFELARNGEIDCRGLQFPGYCTAGAIDACFDTLIVPVEVYKANGAAALTELGTNGPATDKFYNLLGELVFKDPNPEEFTFTEFWFTTLSEFKADLQELRDKATILLDLKGGTHCAGLKPVGEHPDSWQIVGVLQIIAVSSPDGPVEVQKVAEPETLTTEQVWDYMLQNNPPDCVKYNALVFPPEPTQS